MGGEIVKRTRLNIYIDDPAVRKQVKAAAVRNDVSVSNYCFQAILAKLAQEGEKFREDDGHPLSEAVAKARRFQKRAFAGKTFSIGSATLIAQARKERAGNR